MAHATPSTAPKLTDPTFTPIARRGALERLFLHFIRDERDLPFVWLTLGMTFVLIPAMLAQGWLELGGYALMPWLPSPWLLSVAYWAVLYGFFADRYILMLHCTSHKPLWKREYKLLNFYIPWVIGPFAGESPETYFIHHITMHHQEGNLPRDLSSTMKYRRDSLLDFLAYFFDFFFLSLFRLGSYQLRKGRTRLFLWMIAGEFSFYAVLAVGLYYAPITTATVFLIPFLLTRFLMMAGNWGQHAFVCPVDPGSSYKSSITCINARYNRRCFNDGYHISHHLSATRHWTEHPQELLDNAAAYRDHDAILFEGIDFFIVWFFLMTKNYPALARHFVDLRPTRRSDAEIIALMKSRVEPIDCTKPEILAAVPA
jgi:hypothetical protein